MPGDINLPGRLLNDSWPVKIVFVSSMKSQKMQKRLLFTKGKDLIKGGGRGNVCKIENKY